MKVRANNGNNNVTASRPAAVKFARITASFAEAKPRELGSLAEAGFFPRAPGNEASLTLCDTL